MISKYTCENIKCFCCNKNFNGFVLTYNKKLSQFCPSCKEDHSITIPLTNVKKVYGLTDNELELHKKMILSTNVDKDGDICFKCSVKEIEQIVEHICETTTDSKRKRLLFNRLASKRRKREADFLLESIENKESDDIKNQFASYTRYGRVTFEKFKEEILKTDRELTHSILTRKSMECLFDNIIFEKYNNIDYYVKQCKIIKQDLDLYLKYHGDFKKVIHTIQNDDNKKSYKLFLEIYSLKMKTRGEMEKSGIFDKLDDVAIKYLNDNIGQIKSKIELDYKLKSKQIKMKDYWDYDHYRWYIEGGFDKVNSREDRDVETIDDVVDMIEEMYFYKFHTDYNKIHGRITLECSRGMFLCSTKSDTEIIVLSKYEAIGCLDKKILKDAPKLVKKICKSI